MKQFYGDIWKNKKRWIGELLLIVVLLLIYYGIMGCPIKRLTGISCAGCGMTRAWFHVLQFHWKTAYEYHPLFLLPVIFLVVLFLKFRGHEKLFYRVTGIIIMLFLIVYVKRMMDPSDTIVVCRPKEGAVYGIVWRLYQMISMIGK